MVNENGFDFNIIQEIFNFMHMPKDEVNLHWIMWRVEAQLILTLRLPIILTNLIAPIEACIILQLEQLDIECLKTVKLMKNQNKLLQNSFRKHYFQNIIPSEYEGNKCFITWTEYTIHKKDDNHINDISDNWCQDIVFLPHTLMSIPICGATLKSSLINEIKKGKYILNWLKDEGYRNYIISNECTCDRNKWEYLNWIDMIITDSWTGSTDAWRVCFVTRQYKEYSSTNLPINGQRMNNPKWIWL